MTETDPSPVRGGTLRRVHLMLRSNWITSTGAALATVGLMATATGWALEAALSSCGEHDFVDAIPLTPVGTPAKKAVRAPYWQDSERGVG